MRRREDFFAIVISGPSHARIIHVSRLRTESLHPINQDGCLRKGSAELVAEVPIGRAPGLAFDGGVVVFASGQIKVADELGRVVAGNHSRFRSPMPFVGWTKKHVVRGAFATLWSAAYV